MAVDSSAMTETGELGVLALQGDFAAHIDAFHRCGVNAVEIRRPEQLTKLRRLVLPGGESTTMLRFLEREKFVEPILEFERRGGAFLGTCAGVILLAREVINPRQFSLGILDISVRRNGYGRQIDSFITTLDAPRIGAQALEAVFIRAPIIESVGPSVEVIAMHQEKPVLIRQGRHWAATFHPELTADARIHRLFADGAMKN